MQSIAYGTYRNGQIFLDTPVPAIDESRVQVIFLNEQSKGSNVINELVPEKTIAQKQHEAFARFFAAFDAIHGEPITDEDLDNFARNRVNFIRKLDL
jgi:hypothetical protein